MSPMEIVDENIVPKLDFIPYCPCKLQLSVKRDNSSLEDGAGRCM
jgi:hypothetical protein